ncbi:hypothetical protein M0Q50_03525 [bacterium]|jgi:hypothetical protein|nr:hypothetical protein [bacterium]
MILAYDKIPDMKPVYQFDLRSDIGKTFILKPIDGKILSFRYWYDDDYINFNKTRGRWLYKDINLMLIDDVLYFFKLPYKIKRFMSENANEIFNDNYAIKITIKQQSSFISFDDIQLVKYHKTNEEIYNMYEISDYDLCKQINQCKKLISNKVFNVWENDVLVHRSIGEVEKKEQRIKKLKTL